jgi:hypothetical protein
MDPARVATACYHRPGARVVAPQRAVADRRTPDLFTHRRVAAFLRVSPNARSLGYRSSSVRWFAEFVNFAVQLRAS